MINKDVRILVVDDDEGIREGCTRVLRKEGYEVLSAEDGREGLGLLRLHKDFAAAVVDLQLPYLNGIELTGHIHEEDPDCVILIVTAFASIDTAVQAIKRGAYGYISKPFTPEELRIQVEKGLSKRELALEARLLRERGRKNLLEIAKERSQCSTIIKCMADGVLVINGEGRIVLRNAAAVRIFNGSGIPPLPCDIDTLHCPRLCDIIKSIFSEDASSFIISEEVPLGDSTYMANISRITGEGYGAVVVLRDVTARRRLEKAKSMFVSLVSHEVQSPLAVIEGYLGIARKKSLGDDPASYTGILERSLLRVQTLRTMVSELMNLTALDVGKFSLKRFPIDVLGVLKDVVESCRERARSRGIDIVLETGAAQEEFMAFADENAIGIVFRNIVENAVKYSLEDGRIEVCVDDNDSHVEIAVRDDGIGIKTGEMGKIFEEFYRAKNRQTSSIPGTGLGLCLVKRILELHHGTISVSSEYGKGSEFIISIPKFEEEEDGGRLP